MIRYLTAAGLAQHPVLADTMFRDRACQFHDRLGWPVHVDENGHERDQYDALQPLYVIWETPEGHHGGSMRFLPTTGRTMVNEIFSEITGRQIVAPHIWECTRYCLAKDATPNVAALLMMGGGILLKGFGLQQFVGVFDARMVRIYRMLGNSPEVLGMSGEGRNAIGVGLWSYTEEAERDLTRITGVGLDEAWSWFDAAYPSWALGRAAGGRGGALAA